MSSSKMICDRVQTLLSRRRKQKRTMEISAPFDLKTEPVCLPGVSEDELTILREKAAASRIGVYESMPRSRAPSYSQITRPSRHVTAGSHRPAW
ncbi:hypothetical protein HIM_00577 [Hirsutella minnesotensis 3608]|nr:hypothetical protein HIM_00577 [Hirsutella minnesotensis 3608]